MCLGKHGMGSFQPQHPSNTSRPAPKPLPHFICHPWSQGTLFCTHSPWKNSFSTLCFQEEFLQPQQRRRDARLLL